MEGTPHEVTVLSGGDFTPAQGRTHGSRELGFKPHMDMFLHMNHLSNGSGKNID